MPYSREEFEVIKHKRALFRNNVIISIYPDEINLIFICKDGKASHHTEMYISKETRVLDVFEFLGRFDLDEYIGDVLGNWVEVRKKAKATKV